MAATPAQLARNGQIAASIRAAMEAKQWRRADIADALGVTTSVVGLWAQGVSAPGNGVRPQLAKLLGLSERELTPHYGAVEVAQKASVFVPAAGPPEPVLGFAVASDGTARLHLDVTLPLETAAPLLRVLLDAGLVVKDDGPIRELGSDNGTRQMK